MILSLVIILSLKKLPGRAGPHRTPPEHTVWHGQTDSELLLLMCSWYNLLMKKIKKLGEKLIINK